jgi:hypothetical protein
MKATSEQLTHIQRLLDTKPEDIDTDLILDIISDKTGIRPWTQFVLGKSNKHIKIKEDIKTTVGQYLFNLIVLEDLTDLVGYISDPVTAGKLKEIENIITFKTIEDVITAERMARYIDRLYWFGFTLAPAFAPSISYGMMTPKADVVKRRDELFEENHEKIEQGDLRTASKIEKELIALAKTQIMSDDNGSMLLQVGFKKPSMDQIKETTIMRGALESRDNDGTFIISKASLAEGIPWNEYPEYVNLAVTGIFQRAVSTARGGYSSKQIAAATQALTFGPKDSDCKTPFTLSIVVDNDRDLYLRYIEEGGKLVLLTYETIQKYIGKTVKLRSPMYCKYDANAVCEVCGGTYFRQMEIKEPGTTANRIGTNLMQLSMKAFHNSSVVTKEIDPNKFIKLR